MGYHLGEEVRRIEKNKKIINHPSSSVDDVKKPSGNSDSKEKSIKQKAYRNITVTAIVVIVAMSLFPPFQWRFPSGSIISKGYSFILSPPLRSYVDIPLLVTQVGIVALITVAICFLKSKDIL